jgi:hypothetical protein
MPGRTAISSGLAGSLMEEEMARQNTHAKLAIGVALTLGVAFAALPAFAQSAYQYPIGRNADDGGLVPGAVNTNPSRQYYNYAASQPEEYHYPIGRAANDGGMFPGAVNTNPEPQNYRYSAWQPSDYHYLIGRALNDGGMAVAQ